MVQLPLTTPTTSQSDSDIVREVPYLPLPFIKPQLTRVTFTTAASPDSLKRPLALDKGTLTKVRSSSFKDISRSQATRNSLDELRIETMVSKSRSSSESGLETIGQHLHQLGNSRLNTVVGQSDYKASGTGAAGTTAHQWKELERDAAVGMQGALHENFQQSVQVMDEMSDNLQMPFTVVNGES